MSCSEKCAGGSLRDRALIACMLGMGLASVLSGSISLAQQVEGVVKVAPQAKGSRCQVWASAAWSAKGNCWLVTWREGYLNEQSSDIWCARVSAEGKALDPAGIRLTQGMGLKDMPRVASDGRDFLVVWEDLRNGQDWDVYAARVTAEGKVLDSEGIAVASGKHNQCRPDVAFAAGYYLVVWQEFVGEGTPNTPGNAYVVRGARLQSDGRRLDTVPLEIARVEKESHAVGPTVVAWQDKVLTGFHIVAFASGNNYLARRAVDVVAGQPLGPPPEPSRNSNNHPIQLRFKDETLRSAILALTEREALAVLPGGGLDIWKMQGDGTKPEPVASLAKPTRPNQVDMRYPVRVGLAGSGDGYLLVTEWPRIQQPSGRVHMEVRGWRLGPGGKPLDDATAGFVLAADERYDQLLPAVAAGPKDTFLVVWSERQGADDVKVLARVVHLR